MIPTTGQNPETAADESSVLRTETEGIGETVLVVDDERFLLDLCEEALGSHGYKVLLAESGEEALETYEQAKETIDLVILDLGMPGMGGEQCLRGLWELDCNTKVIIASGYSHHAFGNIPIGDERLLFLSKPYRLEELLGTVRDLLNGSRTCIDSLESGL